MLVAKIIIINQRHDEFTRNLLTNGGGFSPVKFIRAWPLIPHSQCFDFVMKVNFFFLFFAVMNLYDLRVYIYITRRQLVYILLSPPNTPKKGKMSRSYEKRGITHVQVHPRILHNPSKTAHHHQSLIRANIITHHHPLQPIHQYRYHIRSRRTSRDLMSASMIERLSILFL